MPVAWGGLTQLKRADTFTIKHVPNKLRRWRKDSWEGIETIKQNLARWAEDD